MSQEVRWLLQAIVADSNGAPSDLNPWVSLDLSHTFSSLDGMGTLKFSGLFSPQNGPILWPVHSGLSPVSCGCPSASFPLCPDLTPAPHPPTPSGSWICGFSENTQGRSPSAEPDVHSWAPPPQTPYSSCRDFRPQGKGPSWGLFKGWSVGSVRPRQEREAQLPSGSIDPGATSEWGICEKAPCGAASQPFVPRGSVTPILPPPESESEIQLGKRRKWEQREGKSFPVKRKEGG